MVSARGYTPEHEAAFHAAGDLVMQLRTLEERAGITKQVSRALRLAVDKMDSSDEDFADAKERSLLALRQIYFSVPDIGLRKELIHKRRECDRSMRGVSGVADATKRLAEQQRLANAVPWVLAGCVAAGCVAVGAVLFQMYGAIAGALLGFFAGQGLIARARSKRTEALRAAQASFDRELKRSAELFNALEEATGEPDVAVRRDPFPP